jgi:general secretion pathway protein H
VLRRRNHSEGFTILELMIVIAILGLAMVALRSGFRSVTNADLSEDATELAGFMRRASQLSVERGEQHRMLFDLDKGIYTVEVCQGLSTLNRNAELKPDESKVADAKEKGKDKLRDMPEDALAVGDPDEATKRALAIAGHHIADRTCSVVTSGQSGLSRKNANDEREQWIRKVDADAGVKFKEIWVQHMDSSVTKGQVAVYFFPNGSSEKAVIELGDSNATRTILVHALTGRIQEKTGKLDDIDDHMMRNALGDRDKAREVEK